MNALLIACLIFFTIISLLFTILFVNLLMRINRLRQGIFIRKAKIIFLVYRYHEIVDIEKFAVYVDDKECKSHNFIILPRLLCCSIVFAPSEYWFKKITVCEKVSDLMAMTPINFFACTDIL